MKGDEESLQHKKKSEVLDEEEQWEKSTKETQHISTEAKRMQHKNF